MHICFINNCITNDYNKLVYDITPSYYLKKNIITFNGLLELYKYKNKIINLKKIVHIYPLNPLVMAFSTLRAKSIGDSALQTLIY